MQDVTGNFENVYYKKVTDIEKYILHAIKLFNYLLWNTFRQKPSTDLLKKTQEQVDELVEILHDNVGKALERGEKISDLEVISENLERGASEFKTAAVVVKRNEWRKHMKTKLVFAALCAILLLIIIRKCMIYSD